MIVVVANRDGQHLLRIILPNDKSIQVVADLLWFELEIPDILQLNQSINLFLKLKLLLELFLY